MVTSVSHSTVSPGTIEHGGDAFRPPVVDITALRARTGRSAGSNQEGSDCSDAGASTIDDAEYRQCVDVLHAACTDVGVFVLSGHGISTQLEAAFEAAQAFFGLPLQRKVLVPRINRYGYLPAMHQPQPEAADDDNDAHQDAGNDSGNGAETAALNIETTKGRAEQLDMGLADEVDLEALTELGCDGFAQAVRSYQAAALEVAGCLLEGLAVALGVPGFFADRMTDPQCRLRFLRYPAASVAASGSKPETEAPVVNSAHTDYGAITMLASDGRPGLEVNLDGRWRAVTVPAGSVIVQLGDMLARWTNDHCRSTPHRVVATSPEDRYTIPFFINPDPSVVVSTIPTCITLQRPKHYPPVTAGEFLISRIDNDYEPYI